MKEYWTKVRTSTIFGKEFKWSYMSNTKLDTDTKVSVATSSSVGITVLLGSIFNMGLPGLCITMALSWIVFYKTA